MNNNYIEYLDKNGFKKKLPYSYYELIINSDIINIILYQSVFHFFYK